MLEPSIFHAPAAMNMTPMMMSAYSTMVAPRTLLGVRSGVGVGVGNIGASPRSYEIPRTIVLSYGACRTSLLGR